MMKVVRKILVVVVALPVLAAVAGVALGPTVLHPFVRRKLTAEQIRQADEMFRRVGAAPEDFSVRAKDGVMLRGWKVRASDTIQGVRAQGTRPRLESEPGAPTDKSASLPKSGFQGRSSTALREEVASTNPETRNPKGAALKEKTAQGNWVLLLHGRSHNRFAMLSHAEFLLTAGYNVVMMDARDHGDSGGTISTYGHLERRDATAIVDALEASEKVAHLFVLGESIGAGAALQSAAVEPRIEAVVAEGAFRNLREVTYDYAGLQRSEWLGKTVFRPAAEVSRLIAERQGRFSFEEVSPEKAVAARVFPVLLICGLSDRKIPCRHSEAIYRSAVGNKQLWEVPATGHEKAIETHGAEFRERVLKFFADAEE